MADLPPLFKCQEECLDRMKDEDSWAVLCEMGTGKSRVIVEDWIRRPDLNLLIVAPKGCYLNWYKEFDLYLSKEQRDTILIRHWVANASTKEFSNVKAILRQWPKFRRILLINIEALSGSKSVKSFLELFLTSGPAMMVIDESTRIKTYNSQRTKAILSLAPLAPVKRILTGLVAPNSPMDLFSQFQFLDWRILGYKNFFTFKSRYAVLQKTFFGSRSFDQIIGYQNIDELQEKIARKSYRALKKDYLSLPPKIFTERSVELSSIQEKIYKDLKKDTMSILDGGEYVSASLALSLLMKLHQVTVGHVSDDQGRLQLINATPREEELMSILEETEGKAIIWAHFRPTLLRLRSLIQKRYGEQSLVEFWGDTSVKDREIAKDRFQNDDTCRWFLGNQSSGGIGNTLTKANVIIYYSNSFNLEHRSQSEDRVHRAGLDHSVLIIDLIAKGTIDEKVINALKDKINLAASITGESARDWLR